MSQFYNPVNMYFGADAAGTFATKLSRLEVRRVLLLTRGGAVESNETLNELMQALSRKELVTRELQFANPDLTDIYRLMEELDGFDYELIVAIGGGSVMDVAKTLSALRGLKPNSTADIRAAITGNRYLAQGAMIPWIGIPTTAGTGSEVTSWATVWDEETGCKYSVADERLYAKAALLLPELTVSMPLRLSAITALDALCHATEAYWSIYTNPITRLYALQAIELIRTFLPLLKDDPEDLQFRSQLALASLYAGLAFSNTRTTACHSISYPLTLQHGIEHGVAVSLTLGEVLKLNLSVLEEPEKLLHAFEADRPEEVRQFIFRIFDLYEIPSRLSDYGVTAEQIPGLVERAYTKGRMDNNPVELSERQVHNILLSLL